MSKPLTLLQTLQKIENDGGTVTYNFEDGTKQVSNINKELFYNEKGRRRDLNEVARIITDNMHDLGATSFIV